MNGVQLANLLLAEGEALLDKWFDSAQLLPLALAVIAVALMMSSLRRRQRYRDRPTTRPTTPPSGSQRDDLTKARLRRDIDALLVELQELSRRISAEIDVRFTKLEAVMRDADRRIATLSRLTQQSDGSMLRPGTAVDEKVDARHAIVYQMADAGRSAVEIARELGKTPGEVELILNLRNQGRSAPRKRGA